MNVVFLSPHFPPNWYHFVVALRRAGATVLGIGDAPFDELRAELARTSLADIVRGVVDSADPRVMTRSANWLACNGRPARRD